MIRNRQQKEVSRAMGFFRRLTAALLTCSLAVGLVLPTGAAFLDVKDSDWYAADVAAAEATGILEGVGHDRFAPGSRLTLAQAIVIACRVHCLSTGLPQPDQPEEGRWYESWLTFAAEQGLCAREEFGGDYDAPCSRLTMARLFARVFPQDTAQTLSTVTSLPDVENCPENAGIFFLYEQGVLTGNNPIGAFEPDRAITRAETAAILHRIIEPACRKPFEPAARSTGSYTRCGDLCLYENYLTLWPRLYHQEAPALNAKAASLNKTFRAHPELDFYVYYIQKDTDMNFQTGEPCWLSNALFRALELPADRKAAFTLSCFGDFAESFYRTDTHWKAQGSYRAYLELLDFLNSPGEALRPTGGLITLSTSYQGNKATPNRVNGTFTEPFQVYDFPYPPMKIRVNGRTSGYGNAAAYLKGTASEPVSYGSFYGWDRGEVTLSAGKGTESILAIGESYDNAVVKLLANHYRTVYSVDLRWYQKHMGKRFDLTAYTRDRGITKVLLIGNLDYFCMPEFNLE